MQNLLTTIVYFTIRVYIVNIYVTSRLPSSSSGKLRRNSRYCAVTTYDDKINELELLKQAQGRLSQIDQYFLDTVKTDRPNLVDKIHDEQCSICPFEVE